MKTRVSTRSCFVTGLGNRTESGRRALEAMQPAGHALADRPSPDADTREGRVSCLRAAMGTPQGSPACVTFGEDLARSPGLSRVFRASAFSEGNSNHISGDGVILTEKDHESCLFFL